MADRPDRRMCVTFDDDASLDVMLSEDRTVRFGDEHDIVIEWFSRTGYSDDRQFLALTRDEAIQLMTALKAKINEHFQRHPD